MDTSNRGDQAFVGSRRRMRTVAEKRRIVEETLVRGASVSVVARKHDVNANLLFAWRKLYTQGVLGACREPAAKLLPVEVTTPTIVATRSGENSKLRTRSKPANTAASDGHVEIEWPDGVRMRLQGRVEADVLGTVLAALAKHR